MDAFLHNKLESDILAVLKRVSELMCTHIEIEVGPAREGGLRDWFRVAATDGTLARAAVEAVLVALLLGGGKELYKQPREDKEKAKIEKEMLRRSNDMQIMDSISKAIDIEEKMMKRQHVMREHELPLPANSARLKKALKEDETISKKRNVIFQKMTKYKKITRFSMKGLDSNGNETIEEQLVEMEKIEEIY